LVTAATEDPNIRSRAPAKSTGYAPVANHGPGAARHFVVTFQDTASHGPDFASPRDFLPSTTTAVVVNLAAGQSRLWLLASALTRGGAPATAARQVRRREDATAVW
jgi:hypothetical protein